MVDIDTFKLGLKSSINNISLAEEQGKEIVIVEGELMNDKPNENDWGVEKEDMPKLAGEFKGIAIKGGIKAHGSDMDIVGTGNEASVSEIGNTVNYIARVNNPDIVKKYKTGEWNTENIGISPAVMHKDVRCSICRATLIENLEAGKDYKLDAFGNLVDLGCGHSIGKTYNGKYAYMIPVEPILTEASLTSTPAYKKVGSGNVSNVVVMAAEIKHNLKKASKQNTEDEKMDEKTEALLTEKQAEIDVLKAEIKKFKDNAEQTLKAEIEEVKKQNETLKAAAEDSVKEVAELKKEIEDKDTLINKAVEASRKAELSKIIPDEKLVASIVSKKMTNEEFKAQIEVLTKAFEFGASSRTTQGGTTPQESNSNRENDAWAELGGTKKEVYAAMGLEYKE